MEDCYFFLYSTCAKATACPFRHCQESLANETLCPQWAKNGQCINSRCISRHSYYHLQKNRQTIPCYWEVNGGCKKPNCPFKHSLSREKPIPAKGLIQNIPSSPLSKSDFSANSINKANLLSETTKVNLLDSSATKTNSEKRQLDFGVKSFEEIMREKKMKLAASSGPSTPSSIVTPKLETFDSLLSNKQATTEKEKQSELMEMPNEQLDQGRLEQIPAAPSGNAEKEKAKTVVENRQAVEESVDDLDKQLAEIDELLA